MARSLCERWYDRDGGCATPNDDDFFAFCFKVTRPKLWVNEFSLKGISISIVGRVALVVAVVASVGVQKTARYVSRFLADSIQ